MPDPDDGKKPVSTGRIVLWVVVGGIAIWYIVQGLVGMIQGG